MDHVHVHVHVVSGAVHATQVRLPPLRGVRPARPGGPLPGHRHWLESGRYIDTGEMLAGRCRWCPRAETVGRSPCVNTALCAASPSQRSGNLPCQQLYLLLHDASTVTSQRRSCPDAAGQLGHVARGGMVESKARILEVRGVG